MGKAVGALFGPPLHPPVLFLPVFFHFLFLPLCSLHALTYALPPLPFPSRYSQGSRFALLLGVTTGKTKV